MLDRETLQSIENENIEKLRKKSPDLLKIDSYIEDEKYLEKIGIYIDKKNKDTTKGFIKLWPEDFLVEEIDKLGEIISLFNNKEKTNNVGKISKIELIKCNIGTLEAIAEISKQTNCNKNKIKHAGLKDFDAITSQNLTIQGVTLNQLREIKSDFFFINNINPVNKPLSIGELSGNQFTILIRTTLDDKKIETIKEIILDIKENGFWNYYYTQRFGNNGRINGHLLGKLFIEKKYEQAFKQFITEAPDASKKFAKEIYKRNLENYGNWEEIEKEMSLYPLTFERELKMVRNLIKKPDDFLEAIQSQENEIKLWLLGFASWLFNLKISEFLRNKKAVPEEIHLITSDKTENQEIYFEILEQIGMKKEKINFDELDKFGIQRAINPISTKADVKIKNVLMAPQGLILQFSLEKGSYATSFLSHFINLISGEIPNDFSKERVDITKALDRDSIVPITNSFQQVIKN